MKRRTAQIVLLWLCLCAACALADARPMTQYTAGQMIDVGFAEPVEFMAGCEFDDGNGFALVKTDFNGGYLLRTIGMDWQLSISGGLPVPEGWRAEVAAQDENGCVVKLFSSEKSRAYTFSFAPTQINPECWLLTGYEQRDGESFFRAEFALDRIQAAERTSAGEQSYTTYYAFYNEANNLDHAKVPASIADMKRFDYVHTDDLK